jgi:hypothetical protein
MKILWTLFIVLVMPLPLSLISGAIARLYGCGNYLVAQCPSVEGDFFSMIQANMAFLSFVTIVPAGALALAIAIIRSRQRSSTRP